MNGMSRKKYLQNILPMSSRKEEVAFLWPANLMKMPLKVTHVYAHCTIKDQSLKKVL